MGDRDSVIAIPLIVAVIVRLSRAFAATFNLLSDWALLRTLPWRYIARLPFHHGWVAVVTWSLLLTLVCSVLVLTLPGKDASAVAGGVGGIAATIGLVSSWARAGLTWLRLRGHLRAR